MLDGTLAFATPRTLHRSVAHTRTRTHAHAYKSGRAARRHTSLRRSLASPMRAASAASAASTGVALALVAGALLFAASAASAAPPASCDSLGAGFHCLAGQLDSYKWCVVNSGAGYDFACPAGLRCVDVGVVKTHLPCTQAPDPTCNPATDPCACYTGSTPRFSCASPSSFTQCVAGNSWTLQCAAGTECVATGASDAVPCTLQKQARPEDVLRVGVEPSTALAAIAPDEAKPTCDQCRDGWAHSNVNGDPARRKINWYFYTVGANGAGTADLLGDLKTFWVKLVRTGGNTSPWLTAYTQKEGDAGNRASWHRSRAQLFGTYSNAAALDTDLPVGQEVVMYAQAKPSAFQFPTLSGAEHYVSFGSFAAADELLNPDGNVLDEKLLLIALSSDSGQATGRQQWTVLASGYQVGDGVPVTVRTVCGAAAQVDAAAAACD
jgi:hypothetical protein